MSKIEQALKKVSRDIREAKGTTVSVSENVSIPEPERTFRAIN